MHFTLRKEQKRTYWIRPLFLPSGTKTDVFYASVFFLLIQPFPVARKELNKGSRWESGAGALLYVRRCGKAIALAEREGAAAVIRMSQKTYRKA